MVEAGKAWWLGAMRYRPVCEKAYTLSFSLSPSRQICKCIIKLGMKSLYTFH